MIYKYIDTIDFSSCKVLKDNKLFYDPYQKVYYKVWDEDKIIWDRKIGDLFLSAYSIGFYKDIAKIDSILLSNNGTCIGYGMPEVDCPIQEINGILYGAISRSKNKHNFSVIKDASEQDEKYQVFLEKLKSKVKETEFFFYDLVQSNIADFGDKYGIIDLESIVHIRDLYKIPKYHLDCIPRDYFNFLEEYYKEAIDLNKSGIDMALIKKAWSMSTGGMGCKPYYSVNINGIYFDGERPWESRWSLFKNYNWKDLKILDLGTCMGMVPAYLLKYSSLDSAVGIDFNIYHVEATDVVRRAFRIPKERMKILQMDIDNSDYENILGYDFDVVFCLSFLRWVKTKDRFFNYLKNFKDIIIEPHDLDGDVVQKFINLGFPYYRELGESRIGKSFPESKKRTIYHFYKENNTLLLSV